MRDINDKEVRLGDFKGKVVILDFWATWCGPCIASFPHTQKLAAKYKGQDVIVLASGTSDTIAAFKKWIPVNQPKYADMRFVFDPNERGSDTFDKRASSSLYGVSGIPTQFVIGRDGKIVASIVGNGGDTDTRTEGALALAGVKVDEATATAGKAALVKAAADLGSSDLPDFTKPTGRQHCRHQVRICGNLYAALAEEACVKAGVQLRYYESPLSVTAIADGWRVRDALAHVERIVFHLRAAVAAERDADDDADDQSEEVCA
jgi:thiol-disulfide isomerase/thioredoxin